MTTRMMAAVCAVAVCLAVGPLASAQERTYQAGLDAFKECQAMWTQKDYVAAGKAYEEFAKNYPGHPSRESALYYGTLSYYYVKQPEDAARVAALHVADYPKSAQAQNSIRTAGNAYYAAEQFDKAASWFLKLAEDPSYSDRYGLYAQLHACYVRAKQYDQALALCDKFVERFKSPVVRVAEVLQRKLDTLALAERYAEMEPVAQEIEKLLPGSILSAQAWEKVGQREFSALKRLDRACAAYRKAAACAEYVNAEACMRQACSILEQVKPVDNNAVVAAYEEFLKLFPGGTYDTIMRSRLAYLYGTVLKNNAEELRVRQEFDKVYSGTPANADNLAAILALAMRDKTLTADGRKAAVRLSEEYLGTPQAEGALYWLADLYLRAGEKGLARQYLTPLLQKYPCGAYYDRAVKMQEQL